jgi:hypothetical protein
MDKPFGCPSNSVSQHLALSQKNWGRKKCPPRSLVAARGAVVFQEVQGATACVVLPGFYDAHPEEGGWQVLAQWVDDTLPYSSLFFFPTFWAVNINWHERPLRRIDSYAEPKGRWSPNTGQVLSLS